LSSALGCIKLLGLILKNQQTFKGLKLYFVFWCLSGSSCLSIYDYFFFSYTQCTC